MELPTNRPDYSQYLEMVDPETGEIKLIQVHDERGAEIPDPVPVAPPLGYTAPLSMFDQMRAQIRNEHNRLRMMELETLAETPDQANDFEIDEDMENQPSLYEEKFDPLDFEVRSRLRQAEFRRNFNARVDALPEQQRELLNGDSLRFTEQRREERTEERDVGSDRKSKPVSGKDKKTGVQGSVSERGDGNPVDD